MRPRPALRRLAIAASLVAAALPGMSAGGLRPAAAARSRLPVIAGREAVASVNGDPITLDDLLRQVGGMHAGVMETRVRKPDPSALLDRIINVRLIVQEARRIGLDRQPEIQERIEARRKGIVKGLLVRSQVGDIKEGDPAVVERLYRDAVREVTIVSLLFVRQEAAAAFAAAVRSGGRFEALAEKATAAGEAKGGGAAQTLKARDLFPEVAKALDTMKPGDLSPPIRVKDGVALVKLVAAREPESPEAREEARRQALEMRRQQALDRYMADLRARYATVDRGLLTRLDYESQEPGLAALRKDARPVARMRGGGAITVKDLTEAVEKTFYHGVDQAIERKRVNEELPLILDRLVLERATALEATRLGLERTDEYRNALKDQTQSVLFDAFIARVVTPEIRLGDAETKAYYDRHPEEYTTPEMMRLESLAFRKKEDAEAALARLRKGADLKWLRANAEGQATADEFPSLLEFRGSLLPVPALPEGIQKTLAGAHPGDVRLYTDPGGPSYVLGVREVTASSRRPFESVKEDVAAKAQGLRRQAALEDWAARLRKASDVKVFATREALEGLLGLGAAGGA